MRCEGLAVAQTYIRSFQGTYVELKEKRYADKAWCDYCHNDSYPEMAHTLLLFYFHNEFQTCLI